MSPEVADFVAKVFLGCRTKILRAADAFCAWRCEGPYRFIQKRSRPSVVALKSERAAEKSRDQLSRDFWGCSIFDFCNKIGTFQTRRARLTTSVLEGQTARLHARTSEFPQRNIRLASAEFGKGSGVANLCSLWNGRTGGRILGSEVQTLRLGPVSTRLCHAATPFQKHSVFPRSS